MLERGVESFQKWLLELEPLDFFFGVAAFVVYFLNVGVVVKGDFKVKKKKNGS